MSKFTIPWKTLIDTAPEGLFLLEASGVVQYANAAALALLGLPSPDGAPVAQWLVDAAAADPSELRTLEDMMAEIDDKEEAGVTTSR